MTIRFCEKSMEFDGFFMFLCYIDSMENMTNTNQNINMRDERFIWHWLFRGLFWLAQWTWGFPQNLVAFIIFLVHIKAPHYMYRNCVVTYWKNENSMSMGMFIFLAESISEEAEKEARKTSEKRAKGKKDWRERTLYHEYGHSIQSIFLGPLYLPVISAPSGIWCVFPYFIRLRKDKGVSYYWFYPERWADYIGLLRMKAGKCNSPEDTEGIH